MTIHIDRRKCEGHGVCESIAPAVFAVGPDDVATVLDEAPGEDAWRGARAAANSCPTLAISLSDS
jgi:ferredoxin